MYKDRQRQRLAVQKLEILGLKLKNRKEARARAFRRVSLLPSEDSLLPSCPPALQRYAAFCRRPPPRVTAAEARAPKRCRPPLALPACNSSLAARA